MKTKLSKQRLKPVALGICGVVAALALLGGGYWSTLDAVPQIKIPAHAMPSPNARDFFIKAAGSMVDPKKIEQATNSKRGSGMMGSMPGMPAGGTIKNPMDDQSYTPAQQITLLQQNAPALQAFRQGLAYPYEEMPFRSQRDQANFTPLAKYRSLARLLVFESQVRAAHGDWYGALNSDLDCIQLGQMIPRGGPLIGLLVGIAVQAIGHKSLETGDVIRHLSARQARMAAQRVERIIEMHVPLADVIQEEKWQGQAMLLEIFRDPNWRKGFDSTSSDDDTDDKHGRWEKLRDTLKLYFVNKREVVHNYGEYMDQVIANARQPYAAHPPDPPVPDDPVNQFMAFSGFAYVRDKDVQAEAQNAQLAIRLAIQAYHIDHHEYPPTLNALVPAYLPKLPDDPRALQSSFGYTRDKVGYTLASGGTPVSNPK